MARNEKKPGFRHAPVSSQGGTRMASGVVRGFPRRSNLYLPGNQDLGLE
jgi:hypothetical protein